MTFNLLQKIVFQGTKVRLRAARIKRPRPGRGSQSEEPLVSEAREPIAEIGEGSHSLTEIPNGIPEPK